MAGKEKGHPNWPYTQGLLEALSIKEAEAVVNKTDEYAQFWNGYKAGMTDAKEVVRKFRQP